MKDYCVVKENSHRALEDTVRSLLQKGWVPHGSMVIAQCSGTLWYHQPMVHYGE